MELEKQQAHTADELAAIDSSTVNRLYRSKNFFKKVLCDNDPRSVESLSGKRGVVGLRKKYQLSATDMTNIVHGVVLGLASHKDVAAEFGVKPALVGCLVR